MFLLGIETVPWIDDLIAYNEKGIQETVSGFRLDFIFIIRLASEGSSTKCQLSVEQAGGFWFTSNL